MIIPISPGERNLPPDVQSLVESVRDDTPAPRLIIPPSRPRSGGEVRGAFLNDVDSRPDLDELVAEVPPISAEAKVIPLDRWSVQAHVYSNEIAANLGIFAGLFGGSGKRAKAGATHEAKRYRVEQTESGHEVQIGVGVRLAVATTEWNLKIDLSVPNIAAAAQLNMEVGDAKIGIDVVGYAGPLGGMLPAPRQLDVATLADYLKAFSAIQRQVFGPRGIAFLTPTALSWDDPDADNEDAGRPQ